VPSGVSASAVSKDREAIIERRRAISLAERNRLPELAPFGQPALVSGLQRTIGNHAVAQLLSSRPTAQILHRLYSPSVVQRHYTDNVDEFIAWILGSAVWKEWSPQGNQGACAPAAKAVAAALSAAGIEFRIRHIVFAAPPEQKLNNLNHFVVIATLAGQEVVVDATQGQFEGGVAQVARFGDWQTRFDGLQLRIPSFGASGKIEFHPQQWPSVFWDGATVEAATPIKDWRTKRYDELAGTHARGISCVLL
jgi:hypothetical protein